MSISDCQFGDPLTETQSKVYALVAAGMTNAQIALARGNSESTIKGHVSSVLIKLGAPSRVHLALSYHGVSDEQIDRAFAAGEQP